MVDWPSPNWLSLLLYIYIPEFSVEVPTICRQSKCILPLYFDLTIDCQWYVDGLQRCWFCLSISTCRCVVFLRLELADSPQVPVLQSIGPLSHLLKVYRQVSLRYILNSLPYNGCMSICGLPVDLLILYADMNYIGRVDLLLVYHRPHFNLLTFIPWLFVDLMIVGRFSDIVCRVADWASI